MTNKCIECESELITKFEKKLITKLSKLEIEHHKALKHLRILNKCLDVKEELNAFYREKIEELKQKIESLELNKDF